MKKNLFILILLLGASLQSTSQITFQTTLKNGGGGNGFSALQTTDGGYAAVGYTANGFVTGSDVFLIKTNASGDTLWTKTYGGAAGDAGWSFQQTTDGGYIITGQTLSFGAGNEDFYLLKTDSVGDLSWSKTFGGTGNDRGFSVQQTTDGGYIIGGYADNFGTGDTNVCLIKTDPNGDTLWTKIYGGAAADLGSSVQQTTDGGYIVTGFTNSFGTGGDFFLIKTDLNGDTMWQKAYGDIGYDYGYSVQQTTDGGYIVAGYTTSFGAGSDDLYLVKTDSIGDVLWSKTFGGIGSDRARSVQQTTDGGYVLTGWVYGLGSLVADVFVVKTDTSGDAVWSYAYGGLNGDNARFVKQTADGGYIVTGGTNSFNTFSYDFYIIKIDSSGNSGCNQTVNPAAVTTDPETNVTGASTIVMSGGTIVGSPATIVGSGAALSVMCTNVGIDETAANNSFSIFPNPSSGDFVISFKEVLANGTVEVINVLGEKVFSENISNTSEKKINLENSSPGIYFIRINNTSFQKIIKN